MEPPALRRLASVGVACLLVLPQFDAFPAGLRDDAVTYRTEGYEHQRQGDFTGAMAAYQKAAALDPAYPTPHNDMGILYEQMGQLEDAKRAYEQALTIDPSHLEAHANLAMLYERMGQQEKAIAHWTTRYELGDPSDPWTARAEERLRALGALNQSAGLRGRLVSRQRITAKELKAHEQSLEEFHALTEKRRD